MKTFSTNAGIKNGRSIAREVIEPFLFLSNSDGSFRILLKDIIYCKSYNSSTEFHLNSNRRLVVSQPIIYYEQQLFDYGFLRIHHSTIINVLYLCYTSKGENSNELTLTTGEKLTISRARKNEVFRIVRLWSVEKDKKETAVVGSKSKKETIRNIQ